MRPGFTLRFQRGNARSESGSQAFRILVVEDQSILRCAIADELVLAGYEVAQAENATEAIVMIGGGATYELILTDVDMPGPFNGIHLADFTKYVSPDTRVIVMSGGSHEIEHRTAIDLFVRKPTPSAELRRHIATVLNSAAGHAGAAASDAAGEPRGSVTRSGPDG